MSEDFDQLRTAVLRFMAEDHADWRDIHEQAMADLCGVEKVEGVFTWRWAEAAEANERERA